MRAAEVSLTDSGRRSPSSMKSEPVPSDDKMDHPISSHDETWKAYFHVLYLRYFPIDERPWIVGTEYSFEDAKGVPRSYSLDSWASRIFVILELSESCKLATYIYQIVMSVLSLTSFPT